MPNEEICLCGVKIKDHTASMIAICYATLNRKAMESALRVPDKSKWVWTVEQEPVHWPRLQLTGWCDPKTGEPTGALSWYMPEDVATFLCEAAIGETPPAKNTDAIIEKLAFFPFGRCRGCGVSRAEIHDAGCYVDEAFQ